MKLFVKLLVDYEIFRLKFRDDFRFEKMLLVFISAFLIIKKLRRLIVIIVNSWKIGVLVIY